MYPIRKPGFQPQQVSSGLVLFCAWPALLLATVCLLPFLNKAFLIDDPHFLAMARQIIKRPLHPMDFEICWNMAPCMKAYGVTPGNTLMGYALVPTIVLGGREWVAHLTQLAFGWIAVIAMASLALRLGFTRSNAIAGTLLLVAIPPFLPMASTAMPDVLAAAVGLVGIERLVAWKGSGKWSQALAAGIALGLAGIARAHLVLLVPLGAFFLFDSISPREMLRELARGWRIWIPIVIGGCLLLGILWATRERSLVLDPPSIFTGWDRIPRNLRSYLLYFSFPLPLALCWAGARLKTRPGRLAMMLLAAAAVGMLARDKALSMALVGFFALAGLMIEAYRTRDHLGVFLALWMLIPLPIVYYGHLPIKYLLPCMPAVVLTCLRLSSLFSARIVRVATIVLIAGGTAYSILILRSDAEFAEFGRVAVGSLIRPHVAAGEKVWYGGHYSAYWYAPLAGAELVSNGREPTRGDLLVVGLLEGGSDTLKRFPKRTLVQAVSHTYRFGRTMGGPGIGLYSNAQGNRLWGFGTSENDRYELWRID